MEKKWTGEIEKLDDYRWRLPRDESRGMRTDGIVYADETLLKDLREDAALWQVANVACLPGIVGSSFAMPDCHYGYGFPIGGVAAMDAATGVVSPGGVGYDINCGVRLISSNLMRDEVLPDIQALTNQLFRDVPSGVGESGRVQLSDAQLDEVMVKGSGWAVKQGYGTQDDLDATEENGCLAGADPSVIGDRARKRGKPQLGTLGSGNHFLEVQVVDEIYRPDVAEALGIREADQVTIMVHCGSRGFGHQVCEDSLDRMQVAARTYGFSLPDPELACAPLESPEGQRYFGGMAAAANYAWANRQMIMHWVREGFERVLKRGTADLGLKLVYDVAHNVAKLEEHVVDGERRRLCVHRKGATRAFGPGRPELAGVFREIGQPVIVPGDMGTASYLLVGTQGALEQTWGSTCHGAGRQLSRHAAMKLQSGADVARKLQAQGITVRSAGKSTLAEEAPEAYKDIDRVVRVCHGAGISSLVARLRPIAVMKG
jgi:tRNA-splicing ligase RtcB (3'-phosphate/5'-hydroxy nucleic acid ligase)